MEFVEPKRGDRIFHSGRITTIEGFDEDYGTRLRNGQWVCISDFEKNPDGVWTRKPEPKTFQIGEEYSNRHTSLKGTKVIRPAVFLGGKVDKIVTTSPCCTLTSRRFDLDDLLSGVAVQQGGWSDTCTGCKWYYRVTVVHTGSDPRLGLYGVCWESMGHGK